MTRFVGKMAQRSVGHVAVMVVCLAASFGCSDDGAEPPGAGGENGQAGAGGSGGAGAGPPAPDPVGFAETAPISVGRNGHTATLLPDGRVLVVGGESVITREQMASVELFEPASETWTAGPDLPEPRSNHVAVRLGDGRVLVAGGGKSTPIGTPRGEEVKASAILFDPAADTWVATGSMLQARSHFAAARLPSGKVLVVGGGGDTHENGSECNGYGVPDCGPEADTLATAELYDPGVGSFAATGPLAVPRHSLTLTSLPDGRAAAVAGACDVGPVSYASSEVFDETTGQWAPGPTLIDEDRLFHSAAPLPSGRVLVGGGKQSNIQFLATANTLDFSAMTAHTAPALASARTAGTFVPLQSGGVLNVGGLHCLPCGPLGAAEIFDESSHSWSAIGELAHPRSAHTATVLSDGRVLIVSGYDAFANTTSCELSR